MISIIELLKYLQEELDKGAEYISINELIQLYRIKGF